MTKILVIENESQTRQIFLECLEAEGFDTICAENGRVGVQLAQQQLPDLVICDVIMPELDGYGVLTTLHQDPITAIIPFIFITAKVTKAELRQGMELGADDYLPKPCTVDKLLRAISVRLEKQVAKQWCVAQYQLVSPPPADTAKPAAPKWSFPSNPPSNLQLSKVFHFIEANYHQPITLRDVAQAVGYSPAYLTNLVGCQTGQTVHRWIVERRMAAARALLLETDQLVEQIAALVGYQNACHFFRQFRQCHNMTPKAWRNKQHS